MVHPLKEWLRRLWSSKTTVDLLMDVGIEIEGRYFGPKAHPYLFTCEDQKCVLLVSIEGEHYLYIESDQADGKPAFFRRWKKIAEFDPFKRTNHDSSCEEFIASIPSIVRAAKADILQEREGKGV